MDYGLSSHLDRLCDIMGEMFFPDPARHPVARARCARGGALRRRGSLVSPTCPHRAQAAAPSHQLGAHAWQLTPRALPVNLNLLVIATPLLRRTVLRLVLGCGMRGEWRARAPATGEGIRVSGARGRQRLARASG